MKPRNWPICRDCIHADVLDDELASQLAGQGVSHDGLRELGICRREPTASGQSTIVRLLVDGCSKGKAECPW